MNKDYEALSNEILTKLGDADECDAKVLKEKLGADLFAAMDWSALSADELKDVETEEREAELEGAAAGVIDKVLTTAARKRLPDSAFCGPGRSFPAHDAAHVRNGLARLPQSKFTDQQKARIRACLVRKAKKFGVEVSKKGDSEEVKILTDKINKMEKELADSQGQINLLKKELQDAVAARDKAAADLSNYLQDNRAAKVFSLRVALAKPDVMGLNDAAKKAYLDELRKRTPASLEDSIADLEREVKSMPTGKAVDPVVALDSQTAEAGMQKPKVPEKPLSNAEKVSKLFGKSK